MVENFDYRRLFPAMRTMFSICSNMSSDFRATCVFWRALSVAPRGDLVLEMGLDFSLNLP